MRPVKAKVSQDLLKKAHLLFNQAPRILLQEIFQNCRRSGATAVTVTLDDVKDCEGSQCRVTIEDDGCGIKGYKTDDGEPVSGPQSLLFLGSTGWGEDTKGLEAPAGMGFFSLCHLPGGVTVYSRDWSVHLTPEVFRGEKEAQPAQDDHMRQGTRVEFVLPETSFAVADLVRAAAYYYPVPVTLCGRAVERKDYLHSAQTVVGFKGGRLGVRGEQFHTDPAGNFYGVPVRLYGHFYGVPVRLYDLKVLPDSKGWREYQVWVDITDNTLLDMVLPDRTEPVRNEKLDALKLECRKAVYQHVITQKVPHSLPYESYAEAHALGFALPEAEAKLPVRHPEPVHGNHDSWSLDTLLSYCNTDRYGRVSVNTESILADKLERADIAALHVSGGNIPLMFRGNKDLAGYSWYPKRFAEKLTTVVEFEKETFRMSEEDDGWEEVSDHARKTPEEERPKSINLQLEIGREGSEEIEVQQFSTFIVFDPDCDSLGDGGWLPVKGEDTADKLGADVLAVLFFNPYDETEGDSFETQQDNFYTEANSLLIAVFEGSQAARLHDIHVALDSYDVSAAFRALNARTVTLDVDTHGKATISKLETYDTE